MPRHRSSSSSRRFGWRTAAWPWLALWASGLALLVGACALILVPRLERRILVGVQSAVAPIVSAPVMVAVDGRTATITGPAADESERDALLSAIADSAGVRHVVDEITLPTAPDPQPSVPDEPAPPQVNPIAEANPDRPPESSREEPVPTDLADSTGSDPEPDTDELAADEDAATPVEDALADAPAQDPTPQQAPLPTLSLRLEGRALTLGGRMSADEDLSALIQPALAAFNPSYLTNRIDTSEPVAAADWLTPLVALLPDLARLDDATIEVTDRQITLGGNADTRDLHDRVVETALEAFDDYALVEQVEVAATDVAVPSNASPKPATDGRLTALVPDPRPTPADTAPAAARSEPDDIGSAPTLRRELAALGGERLLFESSSDRLASGSESRLDALAALFRKYPDVRVEIEGHTDASGPADANLSLSQKRASAVLDALVERGVPREQLVAYGYGEGVPLVDNSTPEGRARNRRIEFRF